MLSSTLLLFSKYDRNPLFSKDPSRSRSLDADLRLKSGFNLASPEVRLKSGFNLVSPEAAWFALVGFELHTFPSKSLQLSP
jgi:hypothetical protein